MNERNLRIMIDEHIRVKTAVKREKIDKQNQNYQRQVVDVVKVEW